MKRSKVTDKFKQGKKQKKRKMNRKKGEKNRSKKIAKCQNNSWGTKYQENLKNF